MLIKIGFPQIRLHLIQGLHRLVIELFLYEHRQQAESYLTQLDRLRPGELTLAQLGKEVLENLRQRGQLYDLILFNRAGFVQHYLVVLEQGLRFPIGRGDLLQIIDDNVGLLEESD